MFSNPHHQRIGKLLKSLNGDFLLENNAFFGGGTAAVLLLGEYRESLDVDFICSSQEGYRQIRSAVFQADGLGELAKSRLPLRRDVRADQYGIRCAVDVDGVPIKLEIIREARLQVSGTMHPQLGVPVLSPDCMKAEKILANADRGADTATRSRDIIDLAMMIAAWGPVSDFVWQITKDAYGDEVVAQYHASVARIGDMAFLTRCLDDMAMPLSLVPIIQGALGVRRPPGCGPTSTSQSPSA